MRINEETVLVGHRCLLVPYRHEHVETYHAWMSSKELQDLTASEPLSLQEEFEMMRSWRLDDDKLTFIVLHRPLTEYGTVPDTVETAMQGARMAGDVNLFLNLVAKDEEDDVGEAPSSNSRLEAECEVMIAETSLRRKGLAQEALSLLLHYASHETPPTTQQTSSTSPPPLPLPASAFAAKISLSNNASRALFARLGFREYKINTVFEEVELRWNASDNGEAGSPPLAVLRWPRSGKDYETNA